MRNQRQTKEIAKEKHGMLPMFQQEQAMAIFMRTVHCAVHVK